MAHQGSGTKVSKSGKVVRAAQDSQMILRMTPEMHERFKACVMLDATIHGGDVNYMATMRRLLVEYCNRIERTASEPVAVEAGKVLRRKAG